jgi:hypothetical protein
VTHPSYISFVENVVLPRRSQNPAHVRLDGELAGGNRTVAGVFRGEGREWKVHEDSHYEPLLIGYEAAKAGDPWPFVEPPTKTGTALDLKPELRQRLSDRRHKYLYIYSL